MPPVVEIVHSLIGLGKLATENPTAHAMMDSVLISYSNVETILTSLGKMTDDMLNLQRKIPIQQRNSAYGIRSSLWRTSSSTASDATDGGEEGEWRHLLPEGMIFDSNNDRFEDASYEESVNLLQQKHGKQRAANGGKTKAVENRFNQAMRQVWYAAQSAECKSDGRAIGIVAAITTLATIMPKLLDVIHNGGTCEKNLGRFNFRRYLTMALGPLIGTHTMVGVVAIESLVAVFCFMLGNVEAKRVLSSISHELAKACTAVIFHVHSLGSILSKFVRKAYNAVQSTVEWFVSHIPAFVKSVVELLTATVGLWMTSTGVGMILLGQTGNAVWLLSVAGAQASTGTAIGALSGAAARNAALAWLGGGTIASGGGGMAAGAQVLAAATTFGWVMAFVGVVVVAKALIDEVERPKTVNEVAKKEFGQGASKQDDLFSKTDLEAETRKYEEGVQYYEGEERTRLQKQEERRRLEERVLQRSKRAQRALEVCVPLAFVAVLAILLAWWDAPTPAAVVDVSEEGHTLGMTVAYYMVFAAIIAVGLLVAFEVVVVLLGERVARWLQRAKRQ